MLNMSNVFEKNGVQLTILVKRFERERFTVQIQTDKDLDVK